MSESANALGRIGARSLAVLIAVLALGLGGAAIGHAGPTSSHPVSGAKDKDALEQYDLVGENHHGPLRGALAGGTFPGRTLRLTTPRRASLAVSAVHVLENGQAVSGVTISAIGGDATTSSYLAHYVSKAPTGDREVELSVIVDGVGTVDIDYDSPSVGAVVPPGAHQSFWSSSRGLVVASLLAALLLLLALVALLMPRQRRTALRRRVAHFTAPRPAKTSELPEEERPARFPALQRVLERMSWWPRFRESVEISALHRSPVELVVITTIATLAAAVLAGAAIGFPAVGIIVLPAGPFILHSVVAGRVRKQQDLFSEQLAPHLEELASAMRAGHGLTSGLAAMAASATEPSRREWTRVVTDEQLGRPLDTSMHSMATRMKCSDVEQVALVASLHSRTGGNMAEVLERVADGVRERAELRRELKALTSQARLSRWVVSLLPPALIGLVSAMNPDYMKPLFTTRTGFIMLGIATGLVISGSLVMRKLTDIKV